MAAPRPVERPGGPDYGGPAGVRACPTRGPGSPPPRAERPRGAVLNAAPADQLRLLDLQALDSRLDLLRHRRATLPEIAELARVGRERAALGDQIVELEASEGDVSAEQGKLEADIEQVRARMDRDTVRLNEGRVSSAKELESLQHEVESLRRRQTDLEDQELEVMERLEAVQEELRSRREADAHLAADQERLTGARDSGFSDIDQESATVAAERAALSATIPSDLLALYDKLREQHAGVGAAALRQRRCEGCRLELNAIEIDRLRDAPDDVVLRCEECRRILVRTPESGL